MGLAMAQVAGRRADEFCDFVTMLELPAVDLYHRTRTLDKAFSRRFYYPRLARSSRTEEQEASNRPSRQGHASQVSLIEIDDLLDRLVLSHNKSLEVQRQPFRFQTGPRGIQRNIRSRHVVPSFRRPRPHLAGDR